ncbi:MAG TPA: heavy-metal-associated domain-containing protein [Coriobacteriia bacterium]
MAASATARLLTTGMHCQSCSMLVQMELEELDGVESAVSDFRTGMTEVVYDPAAVSVESLANAIIAAGYGAEVAG